MQRLVAPLCLSLVVAGCGDPGNGRTMPVLASQSESDESSNSSEDSGNSSEDSGNSSEDSGNSSQSEENSSERSSEESSKESTEDSTDETSSKGEEMNSGSPVLTTAGVLLTGVAIGTMVWLRSGQATPQQQRVAAQTTRQWLVANRHQLALDLGLGAGPALADLAGAAGIAPERVRVFASVLQQHRRDLLAIIKPGRRLTNDNALAFLFQVGQIVRSEARLAADQQHFVDTLHTSGGHPGPT